MIKIKEINSYFNFLINDFGFSGPISYHYVHEMHDDFIREDMAVKLIYDGDYFCYLYNIMQSYGQRQKDSGSKIVSLALLISWIIIGIGIWYVFFRNPSPTSNPQQEITHQGTEVNTNTGTQNTHYYGEKILA